MKPELKAYVSLAEAISRLFHPYVEVVFHDLKSNKVVAIFNSFSRRKVGSSSYLEEVKFDSKEDVIGPYEKMNWDGRSLKSISTVVRKKGGEPVGMVCLNMDISKLAELKKLLQTFTNQSIEPQPEKLFREDWKEKVNLFVHNYLKERNVSLKAMSRLEKKELIKQFDEEGGFKGRHAATYIAEVMGLARATVYNYLNDRNSKGRKRETAHI